VSAADITPAVGRTVVVIAKAPRPGRSKTRLCPPCTPIQAATVAGAALADTLEVVTRCRADRRVLLLDGPPGAWAPSGFDLVPQRGRGLDERLALGFEDVFSAVEHEVATLLLGMDTPQVTPGLLDGALDLLGSTTVSAVLGLAEDGGWWSIGLRRPRRDVFSGVPMSTGETGLRQLDRLRACGHVVGSLPRLRDVDRWDDAHHVAGLVPDGRFARTVRALEAAS
jgi:uncharacterized protein